MKRKHEIFILSYHRPAEMIPPDRMIHEEIYSFGLLERTFYFESQIGTLDNLFSFDIEKKLADILKHADLIIAHFADTPALIAERLSAFSGLPFIIVAHARDIYLNPDLEQLKKRMNRATKILVPTLYNKRHLITQLGQQFCDKIQVIRCGIDLDRFKPKLRENDSCAPTRILSVGRLVEKKGFYDVIRAFYRVHKKCNNVTLKIAGDGPLRHKIKRIIKNLDLINVVQLVGNCTHGVIKEEMQQSDIFILASCTTAQGDREGLPVALLEAAAMELPIISTLHTGIPEGVLNGQSGFLTAEHDIDALACKLELLVKDVDLRRHMGKVGRQFIQSSFSQDVEIDKLITILNEIIPITNCDRKMRHK